MAEGCKRHKQRDISPQATMLQDWPMPVESQQRGQHQKFVQGRVRFMHVRGLLMEASTCDMVLCRSRRKMALLMESTEMEPNQA